MDAKIFRFKESCEYWNCLHGFDSLGIKYHAILTHCEEVLPSPDHFVLQHDAVIVLVDPKRNISGYCLRVFPEEQDKKIMSNENSRSENERKLREHLHSFIDSENNTATKEQIIEATKNFINMLPQVAVKQRFKVVCDESNNSAEDIANQKLTVDLYMDPLLPQVVDEPKCLHYVNEFFFGSSWTVSHCIGFIYGPMTYKVFIVFDGKVIAYPEDLIVGTSNDLTITFLPDTDPAKYEVFITVEPPFIVTALLTNKLKPSPIEKDDEYYDTALQKPFRFNGNTWTPV